MYTLMPYLVQMSPFLRRIGIEIVDMDTTAALSELLAMGFDRELSELALRNSKGNREDAIELILSGSVLHAASSAQSVAVSSSDERITILELSQYTLTDSSSSACTGIAWTFCAVALESLAAGKRIDSIEALTEILLDGVSTFESISRSSGGSHMSIEEFVALTSSHDRIKMCHAPTQCVLSESAIRQYFSEVFDDAAISTDNAVGIVITKPPETIAIVFPARTGALSSSKKYFLFDSHSRPQYGIEGAYFVSSSSVDDIVRRVMLIFPPTEGLGDSVMAMMYNCFEASLFQLVKTASAV